jgi:hypothetical protein
MPSSFVKAPSAEATQWLEGLGKAKGEAGDTVFSTFWPNSEVWKQVPNITLLENIGIVLVPSTFLHLCFSPVHAEYYTDIFLNNPVYTYIKSLGFIYLFCLYASHTNAQTSVTCAAGKPSSGASIGVPGTLCS